MILTPEEQDEIRYGGSAMDEEVIAEGRWTITRQITFFDYNRDEFWAFTVEDPATEMQDPAPPEDVEAYRVALVPMTRYRKIKEQQ